MRKEVTAQISTWPSRWSFLLDEYEKVKYSRIVWRLSLYQLLQLQTTDLCRAVWEKNKTKSGRKMKWGVDIHKDASLGNGRCRAVGPT